MTGFGSAEKAGCRVEIRSLNQRFLDIYIKAPSFLNQHEMTFRAMVKERFSRGKFDVNISMTGEIVAELKVNAKVAGSIIEALRSLQKAFAIPGDVDIRSMAYFHDMFMETDVTYDISEIVVVFKEALDSLSAMRIREGAMLVEELARLTESIESMNMTMSQLSVTSAAQATDRLKQRLRQLLNGSDVDPNRLHQEIALLAGKLDISEEIARFACHIRQLKEVLGSNGSIGRKLDFLVQELNREVNTMSSKSVEYDISNLAVNMKTEIEKMREQVQNLQ